MTVLPANILRRMRPEDRAPLGKAGLIQSEIDLKLAAKNEKVLQNQMCNLLHQRGLFFIRNRMDKRPTVRVGLPDFVIILCGGKALLVEAKMPEGVTSPEQIKVHREYMDKVGEPVHVVWSLEEFRDLLNEKQKLIP